MFEAPGHCSLDRLVCAGFRPTKSMLTFQTCRGLVEYRFDERGHDCVLLFNGGDSNPGMRDREQYFTDKDYGVISVARPGYCTTERRIDKAFGDFEEHSICELLDHPGVDVAGSGAF
jgi:hypothetical protein